MLLKLNVETKTLNKVQSSWVPLELELEGYLINSADQEAPTLSYAVFNEELLLVSNQVRTRAKKRADILALDKSGNGVIIELKREIGMMGVETQALQYLADFSHYRGKRFMDKFGLSEAKIKGFIGSNARLDDLNSQSRIILIAREFDPTIYSMGEWLSDKGVAFRCLAYSPVQVGQEQFISFSVRFDRSPRSIFPLSFQAEAREPGFYWHNIAEADEDWWKMLREHGEIPACFEDQAGDRGERILKSYIPGDRIIAYAKGYGAIGWGVVSSKGNYELLAKGHERDLLHGSCRHRLPVVWKSFATHLNQALRPDVIRQELGIFHPISTSVSINLEAGRKLIERLNQHF